MGISFLLGVIHSTPNCDCRNYDSQLRPSHLRRICVAVAAICGDLRRTKTGSPHNDPPKRPGPGPGGRGVWRRGRKIWPTRTHAKKRHPGRPVHTQGGPRLTCPAERPYVLRCQALISDFCLLRKHSSESAVGSVTRRAAATAAAMAESSALIP